MALLPRFRYSYAMFGLSRLLAMLLTGAIWASAVAGAPGCGSTTPKTLNRKDPESKKRMRTALAEAREFARNNEYEQASKKYSRAYELAGDIEILNEHIDVLIHGGEAALAETVAQAHTDAHPKDSRGWALLADTLLAQQKARPALKIADQMLREDDEDAGAYEKRGRALSMLGRNDEALEALRRAVALDGENVTTLLALGAALAKSGNVDEAALQFRAAYKQAPDNAEVLVALGMAVREQKDYDEAKGYLEKAISIDASLGAAHYELGILFNRMNDTAKAEAELSKAVQLIPNESRAWYVYGEIFRLQERPEEAIEAYRKAVKLDPPHPKAAAKLALLLIEQKDFDGAEKVLTVAIRKDGKNPTNYLNLGMVFAAKRKNSQAIEMFQKFLDLAPSTDIDRKRAKEAINELKRR